MEGGFGLGWEGGRVGGWMAGMSERGRVVTTTSHSRCLLASAGSQPGRRRPLQQRPAHPAWLSGSTGRGRRGREPCRRAAAAARAAVAAAAAWAQLAAAGGLAVAAWAADAWQTQWAAGWQPPQACHRCVSCPQPGCRGRQQPARGRRWQRSARRPAPALHLRQWGSGRRSARPTLPHRAGRQPPPRSKGWCLM